VTGVTGADAVTGPYDVIALTEARTIDEPGKMAVARVQAIPGVNRTLTCPVVHLRPALACTSILFLAAGRPQGLGVPCSVGSDYVPLGDRVLAVIATPDG
jgi:hypothetical protein